MCGQQKSRVEADELPFWQRHLYGSAEWNASWQRRNRVEGVFGNIKNKASQSVRRGNFRVMGLAKTSLMAMFAVMAANLRLADTFELEQKAAAAEQARAAAGMTKPTRKPRRRTRLLTEMGEYIARKQAERDAVEALAATAPAPSPPDPDALDLHDATAPADGTGPGATDGADPAAGESRGDPPDRPGPPAS